MTSNRPGSDAGAGNPLGAYLRERRARLDPAALGLPTARRRTPGLRREEVAQRACVSATWYTWLEQGRGGAASTEALERIARALLLNEVEREHLFLLAQQRPPRAQEPGPVQITSGLRGVLDALPASPAFIKNAAWDVLAWNRAAAVVLTDYALLPPGRRNILHLVFSRPGAMQAMPDWEQVARFVVATFRAETARVGETIAARAAELVEELHAASPAFRTMWEAGDVRRHGVGTKHLHKPGAGAIGLDYAAFAIEEQPGLSLVVYTAASAADAARIEALLRAADSASAAA